MERKPILRQIQSGAQSTKLKEKELDYWRKSVEHCYIERLRVSMRLYRRELLF